MSQELEEYIFIWKLFARFLLYVGKIIDETERRVPDNIEKSYKAAKIIRDLIPNVRTKIETQGDLEKKMQLFIENHSKYDFEGIEFYYQQIGTDGIKFEADLPFLRE